MDILARLAHMQHHMEALLFLDTHNHLKSVKVSQKVAHMGLEERHMVVEVASKQAVPVLALDYMPVHFAEQVDERIPVVFPVPRVLLIPSVPSDLFPSVFLVASLSPAPAPFLVLVPFLTFLVLRMESVGHVGH